MNVIDIQLDSTYVPLPTVEQLKCWTNAVLRQQQVEGILTIRIVDEPEITLLNSTYRQKTQADECAIFSHGSPL